MAELEAGNGNRLEVWVTAVGTLRTMARRSSLGPYDKAASHYYGYGHLGAFPPEVGCIDLLEQKYSWMVYAQKGKRGERGRTSRKVLSTLKLLKTNKIISL